MQKFKILVSCFLMMIICFSSVVSFATGEISEFGIKSIDIPDEYMWCTRTECEPELATVISGSGFSGLEEWVQNVMEPSNFYAYGCEENDLTKCLYLICEEIDSPQTKDKLVKHKLAKDYNLAKGVSEQAGLLDEVIRSASVDNGNWVDTDGTTPFVEYYTQIGQDHVHVYKTIYNGNSITLQFSSKKSFSDEEKDKHLQILSSVKFTEDIDYTEIENKISDAKQKKLEEETHSGKNTRILRYIIGLLVALVILFGIYMSIRSQNKKRKKTIVLREHEVIPEDNDITDERGDN